MVVPNKKQLRLALTGLTIAVVACLLWLLTAHDQGRVSSLVQAILALVGSAATVGMWILQQDVVDLPVRTAGPAWPLIWHNVPSRTRTFTGRAALLVDVRQRLVDNETNEPLVLHGMGGVGKTQLAIEYAHKFRSDYEVVWWIPAEQTPLVRLSLAALGRRLGLEDAPRNRVEDAVGAVLDALRLGVPVRHWLVVLDNADQPEDLRDLLPRGPGHLLLTSRNNRWESVAPSLEVEVFTREESVAFLTRRVPRVRPEDADQLAEDLGDLPLAMEQASAFIVEAAMSTSAYLALFQRWSARLLEESPPADYPLPLATVVRLSEARLEDRMPAALDVLRRCTFFGSEPIRRDILRGLADPIVVHRAIREIGRHALARVDTERGTLQVHRLIQLLLRGDMPPPEVEAAREDVHRLLAAADPGAPDDIDSWGRYAGLLAYVRPSEAVMSERPDVRQLVRRLIRYLFNIGDLGACDALSRDALTRWTAASGADHIDVLRLAGQRADLLWTLGAHEDAFELRSATFEGMRRALGEEHDATLQVANGYGADLRSRGLFAAALEHDEVTLARCRAAFGSDDPRIYYMANNVAIDHALNSDYVAAYEMDLATYRSRLETFGRHDHPRVIHSLTATGHDLRQGGKYREALTIERQAFDAYAALVRDQQLSADHHWVLLQAKDLAIALRKMGLLQAALDLSTKVHGAFIRAFGEAHPDAIAAGMTLGNACRAMGQARDDEDLLHRSHERIAEAWARYRDVYADGHPYTSGCAVNLAMVRDLTGRSDEARQILEEALGILRRGLRSDHHYTLTCEVALATSMANCGRLDDAVAIGENAVERLRRLIGPDHPHTLAAAHNLALDHRAGGDHRSSSELISDARERYKRVLPHDHPDVRAAASVRRIVVDFEPPHL